MAHFPGAVDQEGSLAVTEHGHSLSVGSGQGVLGEVAQVIQLLQIVEGCDPLLGRGVVHQLAVSVHSGDLQLVVQRAVVHHGELKPVVGHFHQRAGDGGIAVVQDGLAIGQELIPGVVRAGNFNAAGVQDGLVDKHVLPITGRGDGVLLAVRGHSHHAVFHVRCVIGILGADLVNGDHLAGGDEGFRVGIGEEEQHVRLGAGLEVGENLGFPLLVGGGGAIVDLVAGFLFVGLHRRFKVLSVAVVAAVGGDNVQRDRFFCRLGVLRPGAGGCALLCGSGALAAGHQGQGHYQYEQQGK